MLHGWNYNEQNYNKDGFAERTLLPEGEYQVQITEVSYQTANSGKGMYVLSLVTLEEKYKLRYFLVFNEDNPALTDQNIGAIFDSFQMPSEPEEIRAETDNWVGRWGAVEVSHRTYKSTRTGDDVTAAQVKRFLTTERQVELGWVMPLDDAPSDLPFDTLPM